MSKFFKEVATPEKQGSQYKAPSGPTRAVNTESRGTSFGSAINDLMGIASSVSTIDNKHDERKLAKMESTNGSRADKIVEEAHLFANNYLVNKAEENGTDISKMSYEEIREAMPSAMSEFVSSKEGLAQADYFPIVQSRLDRIGDAFSSKRDSLNKVKRKNEGIANLVDIAGKAFKRTSLEGMAEFDRQFKERIDNTVGFDPETGEELEIADTKENVYRAAAQGFMDQAIRSGDYTAADKLKAMKSFSDNVEDSETVINMMKQKSTGEFNKVQQINFNEVKEQAYTLADAGGFTSKESVDDFIEQKTKGYKVPPRSEDIARLRKRLIPEVNKEVNFQQYHESLKTGDTTVLQRSDLTAQDQDDVLNKHFKVMSNIPDMSPKGITTATLSGDIDGNVQSISMTNVPYGSHFEAYVNMQALNMPQGIEGGATGKISQGTRDKQHALEQLVALTNGSSNPIAGLFTPKNRARFEHTSRYMALIDEGVIDNKVGVEAMTTFGNDLKKNTNSRGIYVSPRAAASKSEKTQDWLIDSPTDAPWTYDVNQSSEYTRDQKENNYNLMIDAGFTDEEARDKSDEMFEGSHRYIENPDGTETVLGYGFRKLDEKDIFDVANELPSVKLRIKALGPFDSLFDSRSYLSIKPSNSYNLDKEYQFYWKGVALPDGRVNLKDLTRAINVKKKVSLEKIEREYSDKRRDALDAINN